MKKLFLYLFSIVFIIFVSPNVYAQSNYDTTYVVSIPEDSSIFATCIDTACTKSIYDFMEDLISYREGLTNPRDLIIQLVRKNNQLIGVRVQVVYRPSNPPTYSLTPYGVNEGNSRILYGQYEDSVTGNTYNFYGDNKPSNLSTDNNYLSLISCMSNISCPTPYSILTTFSLKGAKPPSIDNNSSSTFDFNINYDTTINTYYYYSTRPIALNMPTDDSQNYYHKTLTINGVIYGNGSLLPTYRTIYFPNNSKRESSIGNIYIGSIPKANISNFKYSGSFYYEDYDYATSLNPLFLFYGRVPHTGYYSYESLDCHSPDILGSFAINQELKKVNFTLLPYGFTCNNDMSRYDNVYVRVYFNYNYQSNNSIIGYNGGPNYGYSSRLNDSMATYLGSDIYEVFENQPYDFSYVLSTLAPEAKAYYIDDQRYITMSLIRQSDNYVEGASYNPIIFGQDIQKNAIIYNLQNYYTGLTYLRLFLNSNTIISGKIEGGYYYYDSGGVLVHDDIVPRQPNSNTDDYDTTYYKNIITSYIDDLTLDIDNFSFLIQTFYDTMPSSLKMFVYISFLLLCFWFVYILVRK